MKYLSLIITGSTALLYVVGLAFYQSYLKHFGLGETQFPLSVDRTIFQGFVTSFNLSWNSLASIYWLIGGVFITVGIVDIIFHKVSFLQQLLSPSKPKTPEIALYKLSEKMVDHIPASAVLIIGTYLIITKTVSIGEALAGDYVKRCEAGSILTQKIVLQNSTELAACQIICNSDQCAYYTNTNAYIVNRDGRVYATIPLNQ